MLASLVESLQHHSAQVRNCSMDADGMVMAMAMMTVWFTV